MRYASSMFFGGQLIDAAEADYDSYRDLGLLCPNCKEAVFLQATSQRQGGNTLIQIPAHFKHFKASKDAALVKECESRVQKYDASEFQRRASQVRNQRLRLLQRHFWNIFASYYESEFGVLMSSTIESLPDEFTGQMRQLLSNQFLSENLEYTQQLIRQFVEALFNHAHILISWDRSKPNIGVNPSYAIQNHFRQSLSGKLDLKMQKLIACEVLDFLHSNSSRPLVEKLFTVACWDLVYSLADGIKLGFIGADGSDLVEKRVSGSLVVRAQFLNIPQNREIFYFYAVNDICLWLAMLPWAKQFSLTSTARSPVPIQ